MATEPRSITVRVALLEQLHGGPVTARELSGRVGVAERDVVGHLEHIARSLRKADEQLHTDPPTCLGCGFAFRKRERLTRPGACPMCRGTRIAAPRFWIGPHASD